MQRIEFKMPSPPKSAGPTGRRMLVGRFQSNAGTCCGLPVGRPKTEARATSLCSKDLATRGDLDAVTFAPHKQEFAARHRLRSGLPRTCRFNNF
jgi:hypothetical protein